MAADLIFTPLNIGSLTVKNRIFRSSISGRFDNERFIRARSAPETHGAAAMLLRLLHRRLRPAILGCVITITAKGERL